MLRKIRAKAGVGWGGMITFLGVEHMVDATQGLCDVVDSKQMCFKIWKANVTVLPPVL